MHVLIVGGLGGLTLAQTLRKQGISFEIFERDVDRNARFQGWAIALHTIVDQLLAALPSDLPDLKESTNHLAPLRLAHQFVYYYSGKENRYGFEDAPDAPFIRAERSRLRDWLLTNLPVQWGKIVTDIEHNEDGVAVHFKDGTIAKGDMLVGADGVHSVVRQSLLQLPSSALLQVVPLTAIVGELTLSGPAFTRQLALGHSAYNLVNPELGFIAFVGLHHALPDGKSGRFYWMFMQPEESPTTTTPATVPANISGSAQWLQTASQQAKLNHVLHTTTPLPPSLREIFTLTPVTGVRAEQHIWRDLELAPGSLPAERVVLLGDAAHAMTPSRGEGPFTHFLDAINLSKLLRVLKEGSKYKDVGTVRELVEEYNMEMLERGGKAVRASRSAYEEAKRRTKMGEHFLGGGLMKVLGRSPVESYGEERGEGKRGVRCFCELDENVE